MLSEKSETSEMLVMPSITRLHLSLQGAVDTDVGDDLQARPPRIRRVQDKYCYEKTEQVL